MTTCADELTIDPHMAPVVLQHHDTDPNDGQAPHRLPIDTTFLVQDPDDDAWIPMVQNLVLFDFSARTDEALSGSFAKKCLSDLKSSLRAICRTEKISEKSHQKSDLFFSLGQGTDELVSHPALCRLQSTIPGPTTTPQASDVTQA